MKHPVLLVVGGGHPNLIVIRKARELGFQVLVVDDNVNCEGARIADRFKKADMMDNEAAATIAKRYGVVGAVTRMEKAIRSVCYVNDKLGLPSQGAGIGRAMTDKSLMRELFRKSGIRNLRFYTIRNESELRATEKQLSRLLPNTPFIVKPTDRGGSNGVTRVNRIERFAHAVQTARAEGQCGTIIVEPFVEGTEIGAQCLCADGEMLLCLLSDKTIASDLKTIGHAYPARISDSLRTEIQQMCRKALYALGLRNGPATIDIRVSREQIPYIVDIGARAGGNKLPELIQQHTGIDLVKESVRLTVGQKVAFRECGQRPVAVLHLHFDRRATVSKVRSCTDLLERYRPVDFRLKVRPGTIVSPDVHSYGYVICRGNFAQRDCSAFVQGLKRRIVFQ